MMTLVPRLLVLLCFLSLSSISYSLEFGDKLPKKPEIVAATGTYELTPLEINLGLDGKVKYIRAKGCSGCDNLQFTISNATRVLSAGKSISIDDIYMFNNQPADIVYDPETLVLLEVNFHAMEGES